MTLVRVTGLFFIPSGQFQCAHGMMCIDKKLVCDGTPHCQDRSDEMNCFKLSESCNHYCDNRSRCIPETFLCDGQRDCSDGTDETGCGEDFIYFLFFLKVSLYHDCLKLVL